MPHFPSELAPRRLPLQGSIGAPWAPLMPAQSSSQIHPAEHFATSDNLTQWDPWSGGNNVFMAVSDSPAPLPSRPAMVEPYVTPSRMWNVAGPGGFDQGGGWPIVVKGAQGGRYYQFGFQTPGQSPFGTQPGVARSTPSVPPPMPFLGTGL